jgi:hypothetical protein
MSRARTGAISRHYLDIETHVSLSRDIFYFDLTSTFRAVDDPLDVATRHARHRKTDRQVDRRVERESTAATPIGKRRTSSAKGGARTPASYEPKRRSRSA